MELSANQGDKVCGHVKAGFSPESPLRQIENLLFSTVSFLSLFFFALVEGCRSAYNRGGKSPWFHLCYHCGVCLLDLHSESLHLLSISFLSLIFSSFRALSYPRRNREILVSTHDVITRGSSEKCPLPLAEGPCPSSICHLTDNTAPFLYKQPDLARKTPS
jgi:hypothetical protein